MYFFSKWKRIWLESKEKNSFLEDKLVEPFGVRYTVRFTMHLTDQRL